VGLKMSEPSPTHFMVSQKFYNPAQVTMGWWVGSPTHLKKLFIYFEVFEYLNNFLSNPSDDNHSKIKNQCLHRAHHQYMMNYFQESIHIVQKYMTNITHFLSCYSTKYKLKNYTFFVMLI